MWRGVMDGRGCCVVRLSSWGGWKEGKEEEGKDKGDRREGWRVMRHDRLKIMPSRRLRALIHNHHSR